jgi:hypothetical protein
MLLAEPLGPDEPGGAFRAEVDNAMMLRLHSGVWSADWPGNEYVQHLVQNPNPTPIVCTVQVSRDDTNSVVPPVTIFDGWHRAKAWLVSGGPYPLIAEIVKTKRALVRVLPMPAHRVILEPQP